jgi:diguanylate cyclase (GGDEF)-like protein
MHLLTSGASTLREAIEWFRESYLPEKYRVLNDELPLIARPEDLKDIYQVLEELSAMMKPARRIVFEGQEKPPLEIPERFAPYIKRALICLRRDKAENYEAFKEKTHHPELLAQLNAKVAPLDELIRLTWIKEASPIKMPRLTDFLAIQVIERNSSLIVDEFSPREYDEKFHTLQAPKLFLDDLRYFRRVCERRSLPLVVAYLDIDRFKKFNSKYGESAVDSRVLPLFMQTIEGHVFQHGFAYRFGGDEYVIVLPNWSRATASVFLDELRHSISQLSYDGIKEKTTISIGFCSVDLDCYLTPREIQKRANRAKDFAKKNGRDCIATYTDTDFEDKALKVISPVRPKLA